MSENQEIIGYIKKGFELREQECYKQAIEMFYKALVIEPDNIELLYQVGELYYLLHNFSRAVQYPEKILSQDKTNIEALKLLAKIYLEEDKLLSVKEVLGRIYELYPTEENLLELIRINGKLDLLEELEPHMPQISASGKCLIELASEYFNKGNLEKSDELIRQAKDLGYDDGECDILAGKILFNKNDLSGAKEYIEKIGKNSENHEVLNLQGLFYMEEGDFINAIKSFSKASNLNKTKAVYLYNLGNAYFLNGWMKEAEGAWQRAIYLEPNNYDYRYSLAYMYYRNSKFEKAKKEIDFILENDGTHKGAKTIKALLLLESKDYLGAEKLLLSNLDTNGEGDDFTMSSLAKVEVEIGKFDNAERHIKSVIEKNSENFVYKIELGEIYLKEKKYSQGIEILREVIAENPNYIDAYVAGARGAILAGDYDLAKEFAQNALSTDVNCAEGYYCLAIVRQKEGDLEEAIECMRRAITYDVSNAGYYAQMAELYKASGDNKTAFDYAKEAESIDSSEEYRILYRDLARLNRK